MNITKKIIITDTNIITDLDNANILEFFVKLDNVYITDIVRNDELNDKTGNLKIINKFKIININLNQIKEIAHLSKYEHHLSTYDLINFIVARDLNGILATGDNRLKIYSEKNGIEVIRTLKIIKLLYTKNIINAKKAINACNNLKNNKYTRIPISEIDKLINELEEDTILI